MRSVKTTPDKSVAGTSKSKPSVSPTESPTQVNERPRPIPDNVQTMPQTSNPSTSNSFKEPNIINLHNVEDAEEWIRSGKGVYIGREVDNDKLQHECSKWANHHTLREHKSREKVVKLFREEIMINDELLKDIGELKGKKLGCWCSPHQCHAEVLHNLAGNEVIYEGETSPTFVSSQSLIPSPPTSADPVTPESKLHHVSPPTSAPSPPPQHG